MPAAALRRAPLPGPASPSSRARATRRSWSRAPPSSGSSALALADVNGLYGDRPGARRGEAAGLPLVVGAELVGAPGSCPGGRRARAARHGPRGLRRAVPAHDPRARRGALGRRRRRRREREDGRGAARGRWRSGHAASSRSTPAPTATPPRGSASVRAPARAGGGAPPGRGRGGAGARGPLGRAAGSASRWRSRTTCTPTCRARQVLQDVLTCVRLGTTVERAGRRLFPNAERTLKGPEEMARLWSDFPEGLETAAAIADGCRFRMEEIRGEHPLPPVVVDRAALAAGAAVATSSPRAGGARRVARADAERAAATRRALPDSTRGADPDPDPDDRRRGRFDPARPARSPGCRCCASSSARGRAGATAASRRRTSRAQLEKELDLIEQLGYASYFLTVWDIVRFARRAASSARGAAPRPTRRSASASASPRSIRCGWGCCSSASSRASATSRPTSTSTSSTSGARR